MQGKTELRGKEKNKGRICIKVFFQMLTEDGYTVYFKDQLGNKQMAQIINDVIGAETKAEGEGHEHQ